MGTGSVHHLVDVFGIIGLFGWDDFGIRILCAHGIHGFCSIQFGKRMARLPAVLSTGIKSMKAAAITGWSLVAIMLLLIVAGFFRTSSAPTIACDRATHGWARGAEFVITPKAVTFKLQCLNGPIWDIELLRVRQ